MATYSYDETGVYFAFFVVSVLAILLIPTTIRWLTSRPESFAKLSACQCDPCKAKYDQKLLDVADKTKPLRTAKVVIGAVCWLTVFYLCYVIYSTKIELPKTWDPWELLGVSRDADITSVKTAYKALSLKWHPDKVEESLKAKAHEIFTELAKAKAVLTNPSKRAEFDEWGHPDGKQAFSMGIALPTWIVKSSNSPIVLLTYGIIFGLLLPYTIGRWWYRTRKYTKDDIMSKSMASFFKNIRDETSLKELISVVSLAREFVEEVETIDSDKQQLDALQKKLEVEYKTIHDEVFVVDPKLVKTEHARKAFLLLHAYFTRVNVNSAKLAKDQALIVAKSFHLLQRGILQITLARGWLVPSLFAMDLTQMLVQAELSNDSPLLQLPHVSTAHLKTLKEMKNPIKGFPELLELGDTECRKVFFDLSDDQYGDIMQTCHAFPRIVLEKVDFRVIGEESITPGALVTCTLRIRLVSIMVSVSDITQEYEEKKKIKPEGKQKVDGEEDDDDKFDSLELEGEGDGVSVSKRKDSQKLKLAHAPLFPIGKRPFWWVFIGNIITNRVINATKVTDLAERKTIRVQFQAPQRTGVFPFSVFIKSDTYISADMRLDIQMKVEEPKASAADEADEDISEPEEDSIAGQMAALRGNRAGGKGGKENNSDEDDEDETSSSDDD